MQELLIINMKKVYVRRQTRLNPLRRETSPTSSARQGFTLMELLIVIALLGFLIAAGIGSYTSSLKKSRDTRRKNDLRQIAIALESYNNDFGRYPAANLDGTIFGCSVGTCAWGNQFLVSDANGNGVVYMSQLPGDTSASQRYFYVTDANGTYFQLYARLENLQDSDIPKNGSNQARYFTNYICGTGTSTVKCNYGVASSNKGLDTNYGYE